MSFTIVAAIEAGWSPTMTTSNEDLNPFNQTDELDDYNEEYDSNKFTAPFTPDQLAPKSTTHDNVNIQVRFPGLYVAYLICCRL